MLWSHWGLIFKFFILLKVNVPQREIIQVAVSCCNSETRAIPLQLCSNSFLKICYTQSADLYNYGKDIFGIFFSITIEKYADLNGMVTSKRSNDKISNIVNWLIDKIWRQTKKYQFVESSYHFTAIMRQTQSTKGQCSSHSNFYLMLVLGITYWWEFFITKERAITFNLPAMFLIFSRLSLIANR